MYESAFQYAESQREEMRAIKAEEALLLAQGHVWPSLGVQLRESTGEALIQLGTRLKTRPGIETRRAAGGWR